MGEDDGEREFGGDDGDPVGEFGEFDCPDEEVVDSLRGGDVFWGSAIDVGIEVLVCGGMRGKGECGVCIVQRKGVSTE